MSNTQKEEKKGNSNRYDENFKQGAVRMVREQKRSVKEVANDLGICQDTLKTWLKKSDPSYSQSEPAQIKALQSEIRQLKKDLADREDTIEILKKAAAIFSRPSKKDLKL